MPLRTVNVCSSTPFLPYVYLLSPTMPICYYGFSILGALSLVNVSPCTELWYGSTLPANIAIYPDAGSTCSLPRTTPYARCTLSSLSHRWGRGGDAGCYCRSRRGSHCAPGV